MSNTLSTGTPSRRKAWTKPGPCTRGAKSSSRTNPVWFRQFFDSGRGDIASHRYQDARPPSARKQVPTKDNVFGQVTLPDHRYPRPRQGLFQFQVSHVLAQVIVPPRRDCGEPSPQGRPRLARVPTMSAKVKVTWLAP